MRKWQRCSIRTRRPTSGRRWRWSSSARRAHRCNGVPDELRARLASHFSPQEVMEIVLVVGFWKMYNTMHNAMEVPIEDPVQGYTDWVNFGKKP